MRLNNSIAKKDIWNVVITINGVENFNKNFTTIKEIAEALDMTYAQVSDLKNGRIKHKHSKFKFLPEIVITRINKTQKEYYNERREQKQKLLKEKIQNVLEDT